MAADARPLPREESTPPVTKMNLHLLKGLSPNELPSLDNLSP